MNCEGCFARNVMRQSSEHMSLLEYHSAVSDFLDKEGVQINILGGEPLLHPNLREMLQVNQRKQIKTTIYTNGSLLDKFQEQDFYGAKLRVSIYGLKGNKGMYNIPRTSIPFDANFMVSRETSLDEMLECANHAEKEHKCKVFFIYSMRELDNPRREFFQDTEKTMPVIQYKELVHNFLTDYNGKMNIHISKRGVFESTTTLPDTKCRFANYFIGGRIIQCPYDVVNLKFQPDYKFNQRTCQQNNTCLMSKLILKPKC